MDVSDLLSYGFTEVKQVAVGAVDGLSSDQLAEQVVPATNPIGWLVWHLTRVQDDHVADVARRDQVWSAQGWAERFDLPLDPGDTGYGHGPDEVRSVRVPASSMLADYLDAVTEQTRHFVGALGAEDLDRVVDEHWDPPVTLGVRLMSVLSDDFQHAGQAAYLRGVLLG